MSAEWFRKTAWSQEDQADFRDHLARSRSDMKRAQYLRIQGLTLMEQGDALLENAVALFDEVLDEHRESAEVPMAFRDKAQCLERLGRIPEAIEAYRAAIDQQTLRPNIHTGAWLDFGWMVARKRLKDLYAEALGLLDDTRLGLLFPVERFRLHASRALILDAAGEAAATAEAREALAEAAKTHSGLSRHSVLGLVGDKFPEERAALAKIARPKTWLGRMFGRS